MTTDFRALCARMATELDHYRQLMTDDRREVHPLAVEARTALAKPEPEGPTDEELTQLLFKDFRGPIEFLHDTEEEAHIAIRSHVKFARAVLARWGRPAPQPVPVSERLPGPSDCAPWPKDSDASAWCWVGTDEDGGWEWEQRSAGCLVMFPDDFTHWLPAHALPLPGQP